MLPHRHNFLVLLTALFAASCGGGGGGGDDSPENAAPTVSILFPGLFALTNGDQIIVRGTASDESLISAVRVAGVDAMTTDNFATWTVTVPLQPGINNLNVEAIDEYSNTDSAAATIMVDSGYIFETPYDVVVDSANNRLLVLDRADDILIAVDLATGARSVLSDLVIPGGPGPFINPRALAIDEIGNRAFFADIAFGLVMAVDLTTGETSVFSSSSLSPTVFFSRIAGLVVDRANNRLLAVDSDQEAVFAMSLTNGFRSILSNDDIPDMLNQFASPRNITIDDVNNKAIVADPARGIVRVHLDTGARELLYDTQNGFPSDDAAIFNPITLAYENGADRVLIVDSNGFIVAFDLTTLERTLFSSWNAPYFPAQLCLMM